MATGGMVGLTGCTDVIFVERRSLRTKFDRGVCLSVCVRVVINDRWCLFMGSVSGSDVIDGCHMIPECNWQGFGLGKGSYIVFWGNFDLIGSYYFFSYLYSGYLRSFLEAPKCFHGSSFYYSEKLRRGLLWMFSRWFSSILTRGFSENFEGASPGSLRVFFFSWRFVETLTKNFEDASLRSFKKLSYRRFCFTNVSSVGFDDAFTGILDETSRVSFEEISPGCFKNTSTNNDSSITAYSAKFQNIAEEQFINPLYRNIVGWDCSKKLRSGYSWEFRRYFS